MDPGQRAPHLIQLSSLITLHESSFLAHHPKSDCELSELWISENRVFVKVFALQHEACHHYELSREFIRKIQLITLGFGLLCLLLFVSFLLLFLHFLKLFLVGELFQMVFGLSHSLFIDIGL